MKANTATHRARLRLPGTAAPDNSSHDTPNVMQPPNPLRRMLTVLALGAMALCISPVSAQDLISNGSFEVGSPVPGNSGQLQIAAGNTANLPGWTASQAFGWYFRASAWGRTAPDGSFNMNLNSATGQNTLSQSFAVAAGDTYTVSYYEAKRGNGYLDTTVSVAAGLVTGAAGSPVAVTAGPSTSIVQATAVNNNWTLHSFTFTPDTTTTATITFGNHYGGGQGDNDGVFLDKVSVLGPVSLATTTTTLTRSSGTVTPSIYNDSLSFDVALDPTTATGTVRLYDGGASGTLIGTGTLSGGTCTITPATTALSVGAHANIVAVYIGDTTHETSTSVALSPAQVVNSGGATALLITTPPSGAQPGVAWATQPTVNVLDASGNIVDSNASITLAITTGTPASGGAGTLIGTTTVSAVNGVATFSGLSIDTAGVGYRLTATSGELTPADSALFTVSSGTVLYDSTACSGQFPRTTLDFTPVAGHVYTLSFSLNNPTNSVVNCLIGLSPKNLADNTYSDGTLIDGFWNSSGGSIARQYNGGGNGSAFTSAGSGNGYRGSHGVLISNYEVVLDTTAVTWKTSTSMSSALGTVSGAAFNAVGTAKSVQVWVRDPGNGIYPTISNFRLTDTNVAASLTPTTTTLARSSGTVTPSNYNDSLSFDVALSPSTATGTVQLYDGGASGTLIGTGTLSGGTCTITPATTALSVGSHANIVAVYLGDSTHATSTSIALDPAQVVNSGGATALLITTPPSGGQPGVAWATQPTVQVLDAGGNIVDSDASITLAITTGTPASGGAGTLIGTTTVSAVNGVATFSGLSIDTAGVGYRLTASSGVLTPADSALFSVTAGTVLYDSTACSGQFPRTTLDFTPVAGHVYTLSFSLNNPADTVLNALIGLSPYALADNAYDAGTLIDGFWNSSGGSISRQYNGDGNGDAFTPAGSGNGYRGSHGVLISNYEVVLDTTSLPWKTSTSMSSALGTVSGAVSNAVGTAKSVQVWVRDPGNGIYPTISNFRLTDTAVSVTPTYASWATSNGFDPNHPEAVGNDGLTNLMIYALNLKTDGTNGSPGTLTGNLLSFSKRAEAVTNNDVSYLIEESDDLGLTDPWTEVSTYDTNDNSTISYSLPTGKPASYARLRVTKP